MSRFRDFDAARAEHARNPLDFKIGGESFTIDATLPAGVLMDLGRAFMLGDDSASFGAYIALWEAVIPDEDEARFAQALRQVDLATMTELVAWIVEESTGRPLDSANDSPPSPSSNGDRSRLAAASEGWNP